MFDRTTNCACSSVTPPISAVNTEVKRCRKGENRWPRAPKLSLKLSQVPVPLCFVTLLTGPFPRDSPFPNNIMERVSLLAVAVNVLLALMLNRVDGSLEGQRAANRVQVGLGAACGWCFSRHVRSCCDTAEFQVQEHKTNSRGYRVQRGSFGKAIT